MLKTNSTSTSAHYDDSHKTSILTIITTIFNLGCLNKSIK